MVKSVNNRYTPSTCSKPACNNDADYCPNYMICAPVDDVSFVLFEVACNVIFTIDFFVKVALVGCMPPRFE
jgi:hypothetical protein